MDFRITRKMQDRTVRIVSGGTVLKQRDYTTSAGPNWTEGATKITVKITEMNQTAEGFVASRDGNIRTAMINAEPCGVGTRYLPFAPYFDEIKDWEDDFAFLSGIVDQSGVGPELRKLPEHTVRVMWFADVKSNGNPFVDTVRERWDDMSYGSLVKDSNTIAFGSYTFNTEEIPVSQEHLELHLRHIDFDMEKMTATLTMTEDRQIVDFWHGYIPPCFGGKPSILTQINHRLAYRAGTDPVDLKHVRYLKAKEIDASGEANFAMTNRNHFFEYLKDFGKVLRVTE